MNKKVIISVRGSSNYIDEERGRLELVTEGKYYRKGDTYFITYKESEVTGMQGTTTTLKVANDVVTLMRFGAVNSQFIFQRGQKHISYYDTNYGAFTVGVYTSDMNINVDDSGGEIMVDYELEIDNNNTGDNDFHMMIREAGSTNGEYNRQINRGN